MRKYLYRIHNEPKLQMIKMLKEKKRSLFENYKIIDKPSLIAELKNEPKDNSLDKINKNNEINDNKEIEDLNEKENIELENKKVIDFNNINSNENIRMNNRIK